MTACASESDVLISADLGAIRHQVDEILDTFLTLQQEATQAQGVEVPDVVPTLRRYLPGGKRIRPLLCVLGWRTAGGPGGEQERPVLTAAAGIELLHTGALLHDDVMDEADWRRGRHSAHRALAVQYGGPQNRASSYGRSAAIVLGNLTLMWSHDLLTSAARTADRLHQVSPLATAMHAEIAYGQWQDLEAVPCDDVDQALRIAHYKTAAYTVQRPLQIGAALAGGDDQLIDALAAVARPLGQAFQLQNDLQDVFPAAAGGRRAPMDDIRGGKLTALIALALGAATPAQRRTLLEAQGAALSEQQADEIRQIMEETGARRQVEDMIASLHKTADTALHDPALPPQLGDALFHEPLRSLLLGDHREQ